MKLDRQGVIMDIIKTQNIETQNQLMEALAQRGIKSTQATLSRDIRDLHLVKVALPGGVSRYAVAASKENGDIGLRLKTILKESIVSYDIAQNLLVIKTLIGILSIFEHWENIPIQSPPGLPGRIFRSGIPGSRHRW